MAGFDTSGSPFVQDLLEPVDDERHDTDLGIHGEIPDGLRGTFMRNGPNPQFPPLPGYHPFDGDGMVHAVELGDGNASYRNRWIESAGLLAERRRGRALYGGLGSFVMPDPDVAAEGGLLKNTANTHTVRHAGRLLALMEAAPPTELAPDLQTIGEWDFGGALVGGCTAHPKVDPVNGDLVFFGYSPMEPYLRYHVADRSGALVHSVPLELPAPVMMHDFAVTENYTVFYDSPAVFDLNTFMSGGPAVRWSPELGTRIGVLPRRGLPEDIRWFEVDCCYVVHFFNAWEDAAGRIEVRAPRFARMPGAFDFDDPSGGEVPYPWHWVMDLESGEVTSEQTDDQAGEFPRVNDSLATQQTRFLYNSIARSWGMQFDFHGVVKYDLKSGGSDTYLFGDTEVSGEHVFAPDPDGNAEDDGWLLTMVTDRSTDESHLAIIDARDVSSGPIARVAMPRRVPLGFHANWFATG